MLRCVPDQRLTRKLARFQIPDGMTKSASRRFLKPGTLRDHFPSRKLTISNVPFSSPETETFALYIHVHVVKAPLTLGKPHCLVCRVLESLRLPYARVDFGSKVPESTARAALPDTFHPPPTTARDCQSRRVAREALAGHERNKGLMRLMIAKLAQATS